MIRVFDYQLQHSDLQVEKRGNFVVVSCVEGPSVVAWSLNVSYASCDCPSFFTFIKNNAL